MSEGILALDTESHFIQKIWLRMMNTVGSIIHKSLFSDEPTT